MDLKPHQTKVQILFILIDGIGDIGIKELNQKTPLEKLDPPYLNAIAETGFSGIMDPVETGLACGSDTAHMNIFGYNPFKFYRGRGSFETMGSGMYMEPSEIAFKCNFAHMKPDTRVVEKRRVDRDFDKWGLELVDFIDGLKIPGFPDHYITVKHATEHRCGVKITGPGLCNNITGTDPLKDNLKLRQVFPKDSSDEKSVQTAKIVNALSDELHRILSSHHINVDRRQKGLRDANIVLLRGCGQRLDVQTFEKNQGLKSFMIAPTAIINGLGQSIGMDIVKVQGATGDYHSDYGKKIEAAVQEFYDTQKDYDFGFIHTKAVDDAGHDQSLEKKTLFLSKVDEMVKQFLHLIVEKHKSSPFHEFIVCVTGDHTTPLKVGDHTFEPVPFTVTTASALLHHFKLVDISNKKLLELKDQVTKFNEISCGRGVLGRFVGSETIGILKRFRNSVHELYNNPTQQQQ